MSILPHSKPSRPRIKHPVAEFPIVGIGASAGGLEALELFMKHTPALPGMALVIVQHMALNHKQMLREILIPLTPMPVTEITDGLLIENNSVYIIPPDKDLSIQNRKLFLHDPVLSEGIHLPINRFFRSLALDLEEKSIGVILSGMGQDGTEGLKAIKEKAGVCFVQDPSSAKFDDMPKSAIQSDVADVVANAEALPGELIAYVKNLPLQTLSADSCDEEHARDLQKIIVLLHRHSGQDFSEYKVNTLLRRIERRMGLRHVEHLRDYIRFLQESSQELDILQSEILIGVTQFFRDPPMWWQLSSHLFPEWFERETDDLSFRIWVPGCSTGEDAYTMAILFEEAVGRYCPESPPSVQIFATDLNPVAIEKAREGMFTPESMTKMPTDLGDKYFTPTPHGLFQISKKIRQSVIFAKQNVLMDPPFTKIDLIICRNLLIYLTPTSQDKLLPLFHFSLKPQGYLFLGSAESTGNRDYLFKPVHKKSNIFQKAPFSLHTDTLEFQAFMRTSQPMQNQNDTMTRGDNIQILTEKTILHLVSPPSVMVNEQGDILYISGSTGKFLEPAVGKANWNIFAMIHEPLRQPLTSAFEECLRSKKTTARKNLRIQSPESDVHLDLTLHFLTEPKPLAGMLLIVFKQVEALAVPATNLKNLPAKEQNQVKVLEKELLSTCAELQQTREENRSAQEESRSANQELQSINEELTTSREEIQSMNEELQTLNSELQQKVDDLSLLNNDLNNFLNGTEIAILFLDANLKIRLFTAGVTKILNLLPSDVGRNISDIALKLNYADLTTDIENVLQTLTVHDVEACNTEDHWYSIRILPYKTIHNQTDGAVITFTDITASKALEMHLRGRIAEQKPESPS